MNPLTKLLLEYPDPVAKSLTQHSDKALQQLSDKAGTFKNWNDARDFLRSVSWRDKTQNTFNFYQFMVDFGACIKGHKGFNVKNFRKLCEESIQMRNVVDKLEQKIKAKDDEISRIKNEVVQHNSIGAQRTPLSKDFCDALSDQNSDDAPHKIQEQEIGAVAKALAEKFEETGSDNLLKTGAGNFQGKEVLILRGDHDYLPDDVGAIQAFYKKAGAQVVVKRFENAGHNISSYRGHHEEYRDALKKFVNKVFQQQN
jgi:hypothetical protein